jgi:hypothetical protein
LPRNLAQAALLFKQACDGTVAVACFELGGLYETGQGVPKDLVRAAALMKQACSGGEPRGCAKVKRQERR